MVDRKRIYGPENTSLIVTEKKQISFKNRERPLDSIRPIFFDLGTIPQANGSAFIESGSLKIICAVYGPKQISKNQGVLNCDFKFAPFSRMERRGYAKDEQEKDFSLVLEQALTPAIQLENLPKSKLDLYVTVLESDGTFAALAGAITCASLALANAGISMYDLVTGCSAGFVDNISGLDLAEEEESLANELCVDACQQIHSVVQEVLVTK
ncbi:Exosome complex component MTR3 [Terramyces sp. JEL0728]|nr:Exosome complex component MTR3 [Terramyces sp. JEL0728]